MKQAISREKGQGGFTLIEVMISMCIMLFIVQGMAMVSLYAQRSSIYARRLTSANMLAEKELERCRNIDYDNLATLDGDESCFDGFMTPVANCAGSDAVFTRTTTVTADTPLANTSQIDVSVTWDEGLAWNARLAADGSYEAKVVSYISRY